MYSYTHKYLLFHKLLKIGYSQQRLQYVNKFLFHQNRLTIKII